jgi:hypothetical protein
LFGENVPLPVVVQLPPVAILTVPFNDTFATSAQTVCGARALMIGRRVITRIIVSFTAVHVPIPVVVVRVIMNGPPLVVSAADGT